jgi:imidazolonepropionase-like amidohydrolase
VAHRPASGNSSPIPPRAAALIALCAAAAAPLAAQRTAAATAFTGVTVITMADPLPRHGVTVVIRSGRIAAVGPDAEVPIPAGAVVIPGRGAYLLPGLVDAHVHLEWTPDTSDLLLYVANGVTTVRNLDGRAHLLEWAEDIAAGRTLGPRIVSSGMVIDGRDRVYDETAVATTPAEGRRIVAAQAAIGFRFVKVYDALAPEVYAAIVDEAGRRGMPVVGHIPDAVGIAAAVRAGQRSVEHFNDFAPVIATDSGSADEMRFLAVPVDSAAVERLAVLLADHGVFVVPTFTVFDRAVPVERARPMLDRPEHAYVHPQLTEGWAYMYYNYAFRPPAFFASLEDGARSRALVTRILHRNGVPLAVGTDAPLFSVEPGFAVHRELAHFVAAGLEPYDALRAATVTAARLLGMERDIGTIAVGKRADLLLVAGNPLEDLSTLRRPLGVMVAGRWIPRAELDHRMEMLARSFARARNDFAAAPHPAAWASDDVRLYTYQFRGRPLGRERTRRERDTLMAQVVTDNPEDVWYELRWDLGEHGRGRLLELAGWGEARRTRVAVGRVGGGVTISVSEGGNGVDTVRPLPDDGLLVGPGLAGLIPAASVALQLGVAESTTLPVAGVWFEDAPRIVQGSVTIERRADSMGLRVFDLTFDLEGGREEESRLVLDAAGEPLAWTWDHPLGQFGYFRSQRER